VTTRELVADPKLVAYCGLYCGACNSYLKGSCPGCHENPKAGWCGVRACCMDHAYRSCADCTSYPDPNDCRKFNSVVSRLIGLVLNSNRQACVLEIRKLGREGFATEMTAKRRHTIPRR
jgi:hypothetical protein